MFASMACIFSGPAINISSSFVAPPDPRAVPIEVGQRPSAEKSMALYAEKLRESDLAGHMRLAGSLITPLGPLFFVLFLRATHGCLGNFIGARFAEMYLLFVVLLVAGSLSILLDSSVKIRLDLMICLGIGWFVATLWYFLLILGTVFAITAHINTPPSAPGDI
jgi:hypothetical protein